MVSKRIKAFGKEWPWVWGHHWNSARPGWRPSRVIMDTIEIWSYVYVQGIRSYEHLVDVDIETLNDYQITWADEAIVFIIRDPLQRSKIHNIPAPAPRFKFGSHLFVYFGGNAPATHKMKIKIKR